ncbi:MAG: TRAP transporter small permease [Pseudomonadota bacterium]|nr:TRAP transporter small permease [Pseudomonadota bacterium]
MARIFNFIDGLARLSAYLAAGLIVGIAALILAEIFSRAVLNLSLSFAWEYVAYFMGAAVFLAAAFTLGSGGHVRVSLLSSSVPASMAKAIDMAATLFAAAIAVYVAYALLAFSWQAHVSGSTSPTIDEVPLVCPRGVMAIGTLLLAVQMIARALQNLMSLPPEDAEARRIFGVE